MARGRRFPPFVQDRPEGNPAQGLRKSSLDCRHRLRQRYSRAGRGDLRRSLGEVRWHCSGKLPVGPAWPRQAVLRCFRRARSWSRRDRGQGRSSAHASTIRSVPGAAGTCGPLQIAASLTGPASVRSPGGNACGTRDRVSARGNTGRSVRWTAAGSGLSGIPAKPRSPAGESFATGPAERPQFPPLGGTGTGPAVAGLPGAWVRRFSGFQSRARSRNPMVAINERSIY